MTPVISFLEGVSFLKSISFFCQKLKILLILSGFLLLSGCLMQPVTHGNFPDPELVRLLEPQTSTQEEIKGLLGSPSLVSGSENNFWYYISQKQRKYSLLPSQNIQQTVLMLAFNTQGILNGAEVYTLQDGVKIKPDPDKTSIYGRTSNIIEEMFGMLGRYGGSTNR